MRLRVYGPESEPPLSPPPDFDFVAVDYRITDSDGVTWQVYLLDEKCTGVYLHYEGRFINQMDALHEDKIDALEALALEELAREQIDE